MEVYAASRRDLANAIQSYNDNDSITFISGAKVRQKSETTKDLAKKNCHRRVAEHELNRASQQQQQAFRLQRYEENSYYTNIFIKFLVLYPFFGAKLDIMSTFT